VDARAERTITTLGERLGPHGDDPLPWAELEDVDAIYLTAGDAGAVRAARAARKLVSTVRAINPLAEAGVQLDALVASARDQGERYGSWLSRKRAGPRRGRRGLRPTGPVLGCGTEHQPPTSTACCA
jgi:hypothetical protein